MHKPSITRTCPRCGVIFHPLPSQVLKGWGIYCSRACNQQPSVTRTCPQCGVIFHPRPCEVLRGRKRAATWCSRACCDLGRREPLESRFWRQVTKTDGCWEWTGPLGTRGDGKMWNHEGSIIMAHRFSWILHNGAIPPGTGVLHKCDNPPCVNPDHLYVGTHQDNANDKVARGRQARCGPGNPARGERNALAKLNEHSVREIRNLYKSGWSQQAIAERFGVVQTAISSIVRGKTWGHIN